MNPRRILALLPLVLALFLGGCGEERPPAPPPDAGNPKLPDPPPKVPDPPKPELPSVPQPPKIDPPHEPDTPSQKSDVPPIPKVPLAGLLRFEEENPTALDGQLQDQLESANLYFKVVPPSTFKSKPTSRFNAFDVVIATVAPESAETRNSAFQTIIDSGNKLVLVGDPGRSRPPSTTLIRPDDRALGTAAGRWIVADLARRSEHRGRASIAGNVVQIRASDNDPASVLRHGGFLEILNRHAGVIFVHDGPGFWREADAQKRMKEALRIQKNIRGVFAHSAAMARGAQSAIAAFRVQNPNAPEISLIGIGGEPEISATPNSATSISLKPLATKAVEIATRLLADPTFRPPTEFVVKPD